MRRIKQSSLDRLNLLLDVPDLLEGLGIERPELELTEADLRFPCPLHSQEGSEMRSVSIHRATRYGWCRNPRCPFHQGGSLLWLYSRTLRQDLTDVAESLGMKKKVMLEYELWIGDTSSPSTDAFTHVEASREESGPSEVVAADELPSFVKLHVGGAWFNPLRFEARQAEEVRDKRCKEALPLLGGLYLQLRAARLPGPRGAEDGMDLALADARFLCRELTESLRISEEALALYYCSRGVDLEVDYRVFGALPEPHLARIYRRMAFALGGVDEQAPARPLPGGGIGHPARCPTLVQEAYGHDFRWPCEGSRLDGVHKIWVSMHELMDKDARYMRELARQTRRPLDPPLRLSLERLARGLFIAAQEREVAANPLSVPLLGENLAPLAAAQPAAPSGSAVPSSSPAPAATAAFAPAPAAALVAVRFPDPGREERLSTQPPAGEAVKPQGAQPQSAPRGLASGPAGSEPAARPAAAAARPAHVSSLADQLARLTSRRQLPIPITAFGSKTHAGDGLNRALQGGLQVGQVVALAGAAGEGKTTFALQLADGVAFDNIQRERDGQPLVPVLYLGGQARPEALLLKSLSRLGKLDSGEFLRGRGQAKELQDAMRVYQTFHRHLGVRPCGPDPDLALLRRAVEETVAGGARAALVVVDPVRALAPWDAPEGEALSRLCRRLATLARDLPVAIVAVITCRSAARGGPFDYAEELAPLGEWIDVLFGLKTDIEIERAGGVLSLDERVSWKKEWKAELKRKADASPLKRGGIDYREAWKSEFSVLMTLKSRWQAPVHTAYHFHKAVHRFEEI